MRGVDLLRRAWSVAMLSKPAGDLVLILKIDLTECRFQAALLTWHNKIHPKQHDHGTDQAGDAAVKQRPAEPECECSDIHRMAGECVGTSRQQIGWSQTQLYPLWDLIEMLQARHENPDETSGADRDGNQSEQISGTRALLGPPISGH